VQQEVEKSAEVIRSGGVIVYPTDTIWGIGCDPSNKNAVDKIISIKKRSAEKNFIVLVNNEQLLNRYTTVIPDICYDLMDFAEKPITLIYPNGQNVAPLVLADDGSIAIRKTKHEFCSRLMQKAGCGLLSTSANISGQHFSGKFSDIPPEIINEVDYVVNLFRNEQIGKPSQIIKVALNGEIKIIRK